MSKHINVNPNFYKVGGRDPSEGPQQKLIANAKNTAKTAKKK